jgi:phenylpyruvate tautomerase PptA (4-oxalocrotonate tautomerase family)
MKRALVVVLILSFSVALLAGACGDDDDGGNSDNGQIVDGVSQALQDKNGWDPKTVNVTLEKVVEGKYATGAVKEVSGGGGVWFAALISGEWRIVWDGNGIIDCASLESYSDYPVSLIPSCVAADGSLKQR